MGNYEHFLSSATFYSFFFLQCWPEFLFEFLLRSFVIYKHIQKQSPVKLTLCKMSLSHMHAPVNTLHRTLTVHDSVVRSHACNTAGELSLCLSVCVCLCPLIRLYNPGLGSCCSGRLYTNQNKSLNRRMMGITRRETSGATWKRKL